MLLIGSQALNYWRPNFRKLGDIDIILTQNDIDKFKFDKITYKTDNKIIGNIGDKSYELELDNNESNKLLLEHGGSKHYAEYNNVAIEVASLEALLAIKTSHIYSERNWFKHIKDYHFIKKYVSLSELFLNVSDIRKKERESKNKRHSMNISNDKFFGYSEKFVGRKYKHDNIHYATCYYDKPIWARCKHDMSKAYVDEDLFNKLDFDDKLRMVREEAYAIALERKIIPNIEADSDKAYKWAIMRICTTLTSGWFREFAVENYFKLNKPDKDYVLDFHNNIGKIDDSFS